jgi:hypothetical protein
MRPNCLPRVVLAFALAAVFVSNCLAQEVGFVDLTKIAARTKLRHPLSAGRADEPRGGSQEDHLSCPYSDTNNALFRTTLVSLDRSYYQVGDERTLEVTIENLAATPLRIPFSPHLADLQPKDPAEKFSYQELQVELWIAAKDWRSNSGGVFSLFGDEHHEGTMVTLKQGEWVRVIGRSRFSQPHYEFLPSGQAADRAYAEASLIRTETLLTAKATARIRHKICLSETWGRSIPIVLTSSDQ